MFDEQYRKRLVYIKIAKAHNVYHRCLCFISDKTTMVQEQKSLHYQPYVLYYFFRGFLN